MTSLLILAFAFGSVGQLMASDTLPSAAVSKPLSIPFEYRDGLIWLKVNAPISGGDPLNFLLDTGAGLTTVNLATARQLNLKLGSKIAVQGVHQGTYGFWPSRLFSKSSPSPLTQAAPTNETPFALLPEKVLALDLTQLGVASGRRVDGLLGADWFRGRVVEIDYLASTLRIMDKAPAGEINQVIPLEKRRCGLCVSISVQGSKPGRVRLDTGCASALQWVTSRVPAGCSSKIAVGLSQMSIPQTRCTVQVGDQSFQDIPTGLHTKPIFPGESGLLGNELLSRFGRIVVDVDGGRLGLGR